jgi:hypothetical protein
MKYLSLLLLAGCATIEPKSWDRCNTGRVIDACDVTDYPPLTAQLPPWPFPLLVEEPPKPQTEDTPSGRLLKKLGK